MATFEVHVGDEMSAGMPLIIAQDIKSLLYGEWGFGDVTVTIQKGENDG